MSPVRQRVASNSASGYWLLPTPGIDQSAEIQARMDANANGQYPEVLFAPGTYLAADLELRDFMSLRSGVHGAAILKLPDGANTDLLVTENFATLTGGVTNGGPRNFALRGITLDGNKANNVSGWPLRIYGAAYLLDDVEIQNGSDGGFFSEWGTGDQDLEAHIVNFRIHDNDGRGLDWRGPHDSQFINGKVSKNGSGIFTSGNATSEEFTQVHSWGTEHAIGWHFKAPAYCVNCKAEGATDANLILDCNNGSWIGGEIFGTNTGAEVGIELGRDSTARYWRVLTRMHKFSTTGIPVNYVATAGNDLDIMFDAFPSTPTDIYSGSISTYDSLRLRCPQSPALALWNREIVFGEQHRYGDSGVRSILTKATATEAYIQLLESTTNNVASANAVRISARDNGSGKTQLIDRFQSGTAFTVDTEA